MALVFAVASAVALASSDRVRTEHVRARLISEAATVAPYAGFWVGLHFEIKPGWHTYWTNPGDSGLAASIEWELPEGMVAGEIRWPIPRRFRTGHLMSYGYAEEVVLLIRMAAWPPVGTTSDIVLAANASWLVCEDICIPEDGRFELSLSVAGDTLVTDPEGRELIDEYTRLLPATAAPEARFSATPETLRLRVPVPDGWPREAKDVWFYPERYGVVEHAAPQPVNVDENAMVVILRRGELKHENLQRLRGVLVLHYGEGDERGISVDARPG